MSVFAKEEFLGKNAIVIYGSNIIVANNFKINISSPTIDISNISVYEPMVTRLPPRSANGNNPYLVYSQDNATNFSEHGTPVQTLFGGKRKTTVTLSGICNQRSQTPQAGNFVNIYFGNLINNNRTSMFVQAIVSDSNFELDLRGYMNWTITADGTYTAQNTNPSVAPGNIND